MTNPPSTILVVDDEPRALLLLRNLLEPEGYRILCAANGAEAITLAMRERPDVILLDLMMPDIDGYEVCRRLREDPALIHLPIIMLTALDDRESRIRGLTAGADDFLSKPFDVGELRARLRTITRLNRFRLLYEQGERFEKALAYSPDGIALATESGDIILLNQAIKRLLQPEAEAATSIYQLLPPETKTRLENCLGQPASAASPVIESPLLYGLRPNTTVEITVGRLPWAGTTIVQFSLRDITEKKNLETQLMRSQRIELLGQMAGGIVHDLNNILSVISASTSLLEFEPARAAYHRGNIQASTMRGANLLRQLLMFARGSDEALCPVDLTGLSAEVAAVVRETFGPTFTVQYDVHQALPEVQADATQVHQILMNLCVNARDAMPHGGTLTIGGERRQLTPSEAGQLGDGARAGDYVILKVTDTGTGIPPEIRAKLFDPFFTTKDPGKGTGLGLATVLRLIRRHQGFVTIDTAVGRGTTFACHFPVVSA